MNGNLRHQVEYALKANAENAKALNAMLELFEKLEPEGWTPEIYAECVKELQRVHMCVIHRSLAWDLIRLIDATDPDYLNEDDSDDPEITGPLLGRFRESLSQALKGIPPGSKL
ncbi:hypothetical protein ACOTCJ_25810 [Achromobacter xylosoxidans]|uniref:hypothetical protein n=1 Tax=Alcaligenes xylosoxydans xylosoxydans TaxID=85698 RepID=UPI001EEEC6BC|nr:hypothetical protein [Achromobacter xylosoxidans]